MKKVFMLIIVGISLVIGTAFLVSHGIAAEASKPITLNYATFVAANSWHGQIHQ